MRKLSPIAFAAVLLSTAVAQARPSVAVMLTRRVDVTEKDGLAIGDRVAEALVGQGVEAFRASETAAQVVSCVGSKACTVSLASRLACSTAVLVEVGAMGKTIVVHLEALDAESSAKIATQDFTAPDGRLSAESTEKIEAFARQLSAVVAKPASDAPREMRAVTPAPVGVESALVGGIAKRSESPSRTLAWTSTGVAVVAAAAAITFGVLGYAAQSDYDAKRTTVGTQPAIEMVETDANSLADRANRNYTISAISAGSAVVTGALATYLWTRVTAE